MPLQFFNGQLLFRNGQLALDPACCCDDDGDCFGCLDDYTSLSVDVSGYANGEAVIPTPPSLSRYQILWGNLNGHYDLTRVGASQFYIAKLGQQKSDPFCSGINPGIQIERLTDDNGTLFVIVYAWQLEIRLFCRFVNGQPQMAAEGRFFWQCCTQPPSVDEGCNDLMTCRAGGIPVPLGFAPFTGNCNLTLHTPATPSCFVCPGPGFANVDVEHCPQLTYTPNEALPVAPLVTLVEFPFNGPNTTAFFRWTTQHFVAQTSVRLDGGAAEVLPPGTTSKTYNNLSVGSHNFAVTVQNAFGSAIDSRQWSVTGNPPPPPTVTLTQSPPASTDQTNATFAWSTTGQIDTTTCELDGVVSNCTSPKTYTGLTAGPHNFKVTVANATGSDQKVHNWTVTQPTPGPPTVTLTQTPPAETASTIATFVWSTTGQITATLCTIDGQPAFCSSGVSYNLAPGQHTFRVDVSNSFGSDFAEYQWLITGGEPPTVCSKLVTLLGIQGTTVNADYEVSFSGVTAGITCAQPHWNNAFLLTGPSTLTQGDANCSFPIVATDSVSGSALCQPADSFIVSVQMCDVCNGGIPRISVQAFYNTGTSGGSFNFVLEGQAVVAAIDELLATGQALIPFLNQETGQQFNFSNATCVLRVFP